MAPTRRLALSASASSSAIHSAATQFQQSSNAPNNPSPASNLTLKSGSRTARQPTNDAVQRLDQIHLASPSKSQGKNSYDDPIILSDTTDSDHDVEEIVESSDDEATAPTALTPSPGAPKANISPLPPLYASNLVERSLSTSSLDRSYAASPNSDLNASSDSTLSSLSSVDSDSDGADAANSSDVGAMSPKRTFRPSQNNRTASTPMRASEESQQASGQSSSSTPTPSRRSARIVSSGSSVKKALQRRDELDAKLTASPVRRKPDSPEPPPPKRPRGRPRKSAPNVNLASLSNARLITPHKSASSSSKMSPASVSARRSSRLSLPSALVASVSASPSRYAAAVHSSKVEEAPSQESGRELRRGKRLRGVESAAAEQHRLASALTLSVPSSVAASPAVSALTTHRASASVSASSISGHNVSTMPVQRGSGRSRRSLNLVSPSISASASPDAEKKPETMTSRLRKRRGSTAHANLDFGTPAAVQKDEQETPRRKRGRPALKTFNLEDVASSSAPSATPPRPQAAREDAMSRKVAIDLLDDDLSELSDDSDTSIDLPEPSQSGSQPRPPGAAQRGRPPSARTAEARKMKRASRQDKIGKSYHFTGLYAGEADAVSSTSSRNWDETQNTIFPAPIHFGAKLLTEERDFCLPYPIHQKMDQLRDRVNAKRKPPRYQQISKNKYFSRPKLPGEVPLCNCQPGSGCGADCLNRMLMFICDPRTCPSASNCTNVSLGRRPTIKTAVAYYGRRGFGLKTLEPIKKDDFIDEYRGEVINLSEAAKRVTEEYKATGNFYLLDYDSAAGELLDGGRKGNITRFANHSCDPNCRIEKFIICGTDEALSAEFQIGLFAIRDIETGEELTYNYGWAAFQPRDITGAPTAQVPTEQCLCGAANCSGILGGKKAPATKAAAADIEANSRKKTAKGRGKGKGSKSKATSTSRVRMRSMTPMLNASRLSAAAMPSSALITTALGRNSRKHDEAQSNLLTKIVIKRRERSARTADVMSTSSSLRPAGSITTRSSRDNSKEAAKAMDLDEQPAVNPPSRMAGETIMAQHPVATPQGSTSSEPVMTHTSANATTVATSQEVLPPGTSAFQTGSTSRSEGLVGQANATSAASGKASSTGTGRVFPRLPLLNRLAPSRLGSAFGRAATAGRGTKDRRWSVAEAMISDNDESSSLERELSDSDGLMSDFQKQDDGPQQHPASKKTAGKKSRRGRHKLQLSSEEAERRAAERRARNAFLARVRRASKRGIVIEDPTQHPLKKISIQCAAAPENTYIPDLPSSLVTLGMTTADARRARNAFLARVRRAMKRGFPKDVAIKMAAKPLPGDSARDTPVMKAQRAYMEQLEHEAVVELSASAGSSTQNSGGSRAATENLPASATTSARTDEDGWVDESRWTASQ